MFLDVTSRDVTPPGARPAPRVGEMPQSSPDMTLTQTSTTQDNDDGSTTTTLPDGASRVDYTDGSSTTTYSDGRVLNIDSDGARTLNDGNGVALDPETGEPMSADQPVLAAAAVTADEIESGVHVILTLTEAAAIIAEAEVVLVFLEPINALLMPITMAIELWHSLEASVRAYGTMGYCYGLMYGALDMSQPSYPEGAHSLDSEATMRDKQASFGDGARKAAEQLGDGSTGVALRNRILVRTAALNSDPSATLNELWRVVCSGSGDDFYAEKLALLWPATGMTEA
jgi:hypothetical protein